MILIQVLSEVKLIFDSSLFQALLVNGEEPLKSFLLVFHIHRASSSLGLFVGWFVCPYRKFLVHFIAATLCDSVVTQHQILCRVLLHSASEF